MQEARIEIDYTRLANEIATVIGPQLMVPGKVNTTRGVPKITDDDCQNFSFELNGVKFKFKKKDHESWVETIKYTHRNNKQVEVQDQGEQFDRDHTKPSDIHEL